MMPLRVVVVEREHLPGTRASGRNAAMVRHAAGPALVPLLAEGGRWIRAWAAETGGGAFRRCGSLLLAGPPAAERLRASIPVLAAHGVRSTWIDPREVRSLVPLTEGAHFDGALYTFDDGVVDVAALLAGCLREARAAGVTLRLDEPV